MSSRLVRTALLVLSASIAVFEASALMAGCSEETKAVGGSDAGGGDGATDASKPKDGGGAADADSGLLTGEDCIKACEEKHKAGLEKDRAIDTCWESNCAGPCIDGTGFDGGPGDAGDGGAPACKEDVVSATPSCDLCTQTYCCAAWDGCFQDKDCTDLNACRSACAH